MKRQRGMSMVVAIFLIVAIALLSAFAVSVSSSMSASTTLQLSADRAKAAARAGLELGAYRALVMGVCQGPAPVQLNLGALNGFRVTVSCQRDGAGAGTVFDITAFAQRGNYGTTNYASHTLVARYN